MSDSIDVAIIGLWGVIIGALLSLIGGVIVPWIRDSLERQRISREAIARERRDLTLAAMAALLEMRQAGGAEPSTGLAQVKFGKRFNELTVRLTREEQPVREVLLLMLSIIKSQSTDTPKLVGEAMESLTLWARGEIRTEQLISTVERRAEVQFSEDRGHVIRSPKATSDAHSR